MGLKSIFTQGLNDGVFTAAEALLASSGKVLFHHRVGKITPKSQFDLASLTKPLAVSLLFLQCVDCGLLDFKQTVGEFFKTKTLQNVKLLELLQHRSGLMAWHPFLRQQLSQKKIAFQKNKKFILEKILNESSFLKKTKRTRYSDLGFIVLGEILEKITHQTLDKLFLENMAKPLKLEESLNFYSVNKAKPRGIDFVPSEYCEDRKALIEGVVQDENAYLMGGVAGHAGLFGSAKALHYLFQDLQKAPKGRSKILSQDSYILLQNGLKIPLAKRSRFVLGFDTIAKKNSFFGNKFSRKQSLCHLGFSGTSFLWDLKKEIVVILLTNTRIFGRDNQKINGFRKTFHNRAAQFLKRNYEKLE